jgi:GT2 family glycosyltransferase
MVAGRLGNNDSMVSIIIINYNTYQLTCNCISSIIRFTKEVAYEIILVDNASVEKLPIPFTEVFGSRILFVQSPKNLGFAGGNNLGIEQAKGDYVLLLNSDTELLEDSISKAFNFIKHKEKVGAVTCKLLNPDRQTIQNAARPFFSLKKHFLKTTGLSAIFKKQYEKSNVQYDMHSSFACDWIWGTFFLFPKKNLDTMNGKLTETFFMYSEDVEWCHVFHINGLQNYYFADTAIVHHMGKSNNPTQRKKNIRRSHLEFLTKYHGLWRLLFWKGYCSF